MSEPEFSDLLRRVEAEEPGAWDQLMRLVYQDLKRVAHNQMTRIAPGQTLSTTVLVHEAFEKMVAQAGLAINDRSHFYALCASAMRQIVIDHYRRRSADKRTLDSGAMADYETRRVNPEMDTALSELGRALNLLDRRDPRLVQAFEMRFFAGLTDIEIASQLGLSERTVQRLVARARAWVAAGLDPGS